MIRKWAWNLVYLSGVLVAGAGFARGAEPAPKVDFSRDIQPILSDNCYFCHGPDSGKRKGDLRLDKLDPQIGPFAPRDGYTIIKPGKLDESTLADRITSDDPDVKMPPPASHRALTSAQVVLLQQWIEQGAKWGKLTLVADSRRHVPRLPAVKDASWPRNPIDAFILARFLEKEGLAPSPVAEKATLIRRVTFDLIGLPPTPAEVDAFVADSSSDAYEKVVDRLMNSPRAMVASEDGLGIGSIYARYADTNEVPGRLGAHDVALARLGGQSVQRQHALRPVCHEAARRRSPAGARPQDDKIATAFLRNQHDQRRGAVASPKKIASIM